MDFQIPPATQNILDRMRAFLDEEVLPLEPRFLSQPFRSLLPEIQALRSRVKAQGLWAPGHPAELGGMGLGLVDLGLISEVLGRSPLGHFVFGSQAPDAGNIEVLHQYGTDEQRNRYLAPLVRGDIRSCFSMTEVDMPGSNPVMMETRAVKDGDDYVIDGRKWYTSSADGAAFAVVMAVTNPDAEPYRRSSMILVPTDTPGFRRVRNISVMGEEGEDFFSHAEVVYEGCRVPQKNLLGPEGQGFVIAQQRLGPGRIHHCMRWLGICARALDLTCRQVVRRRVGADGTVLADKELIQAGIAEAAADIAASRALTLQTAWTIEHQGWKEAREDISMIKFVVANTLQRVVDQAIQIHGGLGMSDDTPLAWFYRHERAARIYDGPDEVHKLSLARRVLKGYR